MESSDPEVIEALACLHGHSAGTLLVDGSPREVKYVIDPADGSVITVLDPRDTEGDEYLLCLPDDSFETLLRALVEPTPLGDDGAWADRHGAYHGPTQLTSWVRLKIAHAKLASGPVVDGDELVAPNAFASEQTRLCAALNEDPERLRRICERSAGVSIEDPIAVGVDPLGADVRARFGVVRVAFEAPATDAEAALRTLESLG
ncbi:MAG: hypothetical protein RIB60_09605 [Phycisphaerales bacterium]